MDTRSPAILIIMFLLPGWVITPTAGQKSTTLTLLKVLTGQCLTLML